MAIGLRYFPNNETIKVNEEHMNMRGQGKKKKKKNHCSYIFINSIQSVPKVRPVKLRWVIKRFFF